MNYTKTGVETVFRCLECKKIYDGFSMTKDCFDRHFDNEYTAPIILNWLINSHATMSEALDASGKKEYWLFWPHGLDGNHYDQPLTQRDEYSNPKMAIFAAMKGFDIPK